VQIDELQRREAAAREEAEELRGRIAQLAGRLAGTLPPQTINHLNQKLPGPGQATTPGNFY
jgi:hypothetical protein